MDDKLIKSIDIFQKEDKWRGSLDQPYINNGYLCVLYDSMLMVRTKLTIDEAPLYDNISNEKTVILNGYFGNSIDTPIPVGAVSSLLSVVNSKDKDFTCENCAGTGEAECGECGTMVECKDCNGTGKRDKPNKYKIKINDSIYYVEQMSKIIELCELNDVKTMHLIHKHNYIHTFTAGRYEFIMSKYMGDDHDVCIITKENENDTVNKNN